MRFSQATGCFYPYDISYGALPSDVIEVSTDAYMRAMTRASGDMLTVVDGELCVVPAPELTGSDRLQRAMARALIQVEQFYEDVVQGMVGKVGSVEKNSWALKLDLARAIISKRPFREVDSWFLESAGLKSDEDRLGWAELVLEKASAHAVALGRAERLRADGKLAVRAARDEQEIKAALDALSKAAEAAVRSFV
ncbi:MAG: hypothetical protein LWW92_02525 [Rhodocyclales bacterium]|nr:hypothetical protein [Rhodocyclales bacterium]